MTAILVAVTNAKARSELAAMFREAGFTTVTATAHEDLNRALDASRVDLVLLDRTRRGKNFLRAIRERNDLRVIALSEDPQDRLTALASGADDVCDAGPELVARALALARRIAPARPQITTSDLVIDIDSREVIKRGRVVEVPAREFDLLLYLATTPRKAYTHAHLYREVWHDDLDRLKITTVAEHVYRLRRRIEDDPWHPRHVVTVRGAGYRFDP